MLDKLNEEVANLLSSDTTGHGMDHVIRVTKLATSFANSENANIDTTTLIAMLHDVDDYKLFGEDSQKNLWNAKKIMKSMGVDEETRKEVCDQLHTIGYSKYLKNLRPTTLEGKIVSDADMCDALGATGILRVFQFGLKINRPFFKEDSFPKEESTYESHLIPADSTINFIFEVLFKYPDLMLTRAGKKEAKIRMKIMIDFLYSYFKEVNADAWIKYLDDYLQ